MEMQRFGSGVAVLCGRRREQKNQPGDKEHQRANDHEGLAEAPAARGKDAGALVHW